jgi:hypothetical protein
MVEHARASQADHRTGMVTTVSIRYSMCSMETTHVCTSCTTQISTLSPSPTSRNLVPLLLRLAQIWLRFSSGLLTLLTTLWQSQKKLPTFNEFQNWLSEDMVDLKHFAGAVGRVTVRRLDKEQNKLTVRTIRNKMRKFVSRWQRDTGLTIPQDVYDLMTPVSTPSAAHTKLPMDLTNK